MEEKKHIYNFDILKITAVLLIVCHHYQQSAGVRFGGIEFYNGSFYFGYLVELFFIISGFLTEYTYKDDAKLINWILGKAKRIYPYTTLACAVFLANAFVYYCIFHEPMFNIRYSGSVIIASLLLVHEGWLWDLPSIAVNNPTWYLCVLLLCYLIYIAVRKAVPKDKCKYIYIYFFIAVLGCVLKRNMYPNGIPLLGSTNGRGYAGFFLGCFLCKLIKDADRKKAAAAAAAILIISVLYFYLTGFNWEVLTYLFFPSIVMAAYSLPQLRLDALKAAGAISFEVYLWHSPLYGIFMTLFKFYGITISHSYLTLFVFNLIVVIFSTFIYFVYEKPISKLLRNWGNH